MALSGFRIWRRRVPGAALLVNSLVLNSGLIPQSSTRHLKLTTGSPSRSLHARPFSWPHTQDARCPCPPHPREAEVGGHAGSGCRMGHWSPGDTASDGPCWPTAVPEAVAAAASSGLEQASWVPRSQAGAPPGQTLCSSLRKDQETRLVGVAPTCPCAGAPGRGHVICRYAEDGALTTTAFLGFASPSASIRVSSRSHRAPSTAPVWTPAGRPTLSEGDTGST